MRPGRRAIRLGSLSLCILAGGCAMENANENEAVFNEREPTFAELRVDRDAVSAGEDVTLTLTNRSDEMIGYNLCVSTLEYRDGESWVQAAEQPTEICTMELRTLSPDGSDSFRHTMPAGLPPGEYRMWTNVEWPLGAGQETLITRSFRIES